MKLTKKVLAVGLSALLVLPMALPALAAEPTPEETLAASMTALQSAINRGINYEAYQEGTTAAFTEKLDAAKEVVAKEGVTAEELDAALAAMQEAKSSLQYVDGVAGAFAADNTAASTKTDGKGVIQMDWTPADIAPIDLSQSDLTKVFLSFKVTLTNEGEAADADVFKTGKLLLRSEDTEGKENNVSYDVAQRLPGLKKGENVIRVAAADFTGTTGKIDWSKINRMRLFIDSTNNFDGPFSLQMSDIRIIDETPDDYKPVEGVVATFRDEKVYANVGGTDKTLPAGWIATTPVDISDKDLSNMFLQVEYTLTNDTGLADKEVFNAGFFRLRSADTAGAVPPEGENNVGYSMKNLMDNKIIEQPVTGKNSVKIPLLAFIDQKGKMDWSTLGRFRMYFDNLPADLEAGKVTLQINSAYVIDENVELGEGVLGMFKDDTTYSSNEEKTLLESSWVKTGKLIDASKNLNNTYLHVNLTLTGGSENSFKAGYFRLRSVDTGALPEGENNVGYNLAKLGKTLAAGDNDLWIPLNTFEDPKGSMDWENVEQFRLYINLPAGETEASTLKFNTIEIVDRTVDSDPTIVGSFTKALGNYTASGNKSLELSWTDADAAFDVLDSDKDESYLHVKLNMTNNSGIADADAFKTGKFLLASENTDESKTEDNQTGENSVMVDIQKHQIALVSGTNDLKIPLSAFETEKGSIDWANVSKFRMFIDSTNQIEGETGMTIELVEVVDPSQTGEEPEPEYTLGDVDGKDGVTASDALLALQAATDKITLNETQKLAADVNGNGKVTAEDALLILQFTTQKIGSFPAQDK